MTARLHLRRLLTAAVLPLSIACGSADDPTTSDGQQDPSVVLDERGEPDPVGVDISRDGAPCSPVPDSGWAAEGQTPIAVAVAGQLRIGGMVSCD